MENFIYYMVGYMVAKYHLVEKLSDLTISSFKGIFRK